MSLLARAKRRVAGTIE